MSRGIVVFKEKVKRSKGLYKAYSFGGKIIVNFLKLFVRPDSKLILFNSFGGKKFDDSPKAIYEQMRKDERFNSYKLVWAFHNPDEFSGIENKIQTDRLPYFITALKARCWVSNSTIQRGIVFKGKKTFSFNTWHGSPIKSMANSGNGKNQIMDMCDVILAQSRFEVDAFVHDWKLPADKYKVFGYPRNDRLAHYTEEEKEQTKKRLGIPLDNYVVLYAPTFRDYLLDSDSRCTLEVPFDYAYWKNLFQENLTFLMRMHYEVARHNTLPDDPMWIDMTDYPNLNDLMIVADALISDYSSIIFDFAVMDKPIINYTYDYDEYKLKRGLWIDVRKEFPCTDSSQELADLMQDAILNPSKYIEHTTLFREKYVEEYGNATNLSVDCIYNNISDN